MSINSNIYMHEADKAAIQALKSIPGFTQLLKAYLKVWNERQYRITNMSSAIRISEKQLAKYHHMLLAVCERIDIDVPELYLKLDVNANAHTYGDTKPFIVITSGLLETLPDELIPTVIAHECGHIACRHTMYTTMGSMILNGLFLSGVLPSLATTPIQIAFAYWMRCSEFSADRVATLYDGSSDKMVEVCMRLAGCDKDIVADVSVEAFMEQALEYKDLVKNNKWDKTLEFLMYHQIDHPLTAVRAYECREWGNSELYSKVIRYMAEGQELQMSDDMAEREIPMSESVKFYLGKEYGEVQDMLIDAGFTSIQTIRTTEKSLFTKPGQTVKIQINEEESFDRGTWYPEDSRITITYYEPLSQEEISASHDGMIQSPDSSRKYIGRNYQDVMNELGDAGFSEITSEPQSVKKGVFSKPDCIVKIAICGQTQFSKGDWFAPDSKIRITYQIVEDGK